MHVELTSRVRLLLAVLFGLCIFAVAAARGAVPATPPTNCAEWLVDIQSMTFDEGNAYFSGGALSQFNLNCAIARWGANFGSRGYLHSTDHLPWLLCNHGTATYFAVYQSWQKGGSTEQDEACKKADAGLCGSDMCPPANTLNGCLGRIYRFDNTMALPDGFAAKVRDGRMVLPAACAGVVDFEGPTAPPAPSPTPPPPTTIPPPSPTCPPCAPPRPNALACKALRRSYDRLASFRLALRAEQVAGMREQGCTNLP